VVVVASYPLSSQAPTPVEVELGCDNRPSLYPQDACEYILVSLLLLFCPDLLDLKERTKVEEIQTKFAVLLQKYLNQK
jgi:hypothetical protein